MRLLALLLAGAATLGAQSIAPGVTVIDACGGRPDTQSASGPYLIEDSAYDASCNPTLKSDAATPLFNIYTLHYNGSTWVKTLALSSTFRADNSIPSDCSIGNPTIDGSGHISFTVQDDITGTGTSGACTSGSYASQNPGTGAKYDVWVSSTFPATVSTSSRAFMNGVYAADTLNICGAVASQTVSVTAGAGSTSVQISNAYGIEAGQNLTLGSGGTLEIIPVAMSYAGGNTVPLQSATGFSHPSGAFAGWHAAWQCQAGSLDPHIAPGSGYLEAALLAHGQSFASPNNFALWMVAVAPITWSTIPVIGTVIYADAAPAWTGADVRAAANLACTRFTKPTSMTVSGSTMTIYTQADQVVGLGTATCQAAGAVYQNTSGIFHYQLNLTTGATSGWTQDYPRSGQPLVDGAGNWIAYAEFPTILPGSRFLLIYTNTFTSRLQINLLPNNANYPCEVGVVDLVTGNYYQVTDFNRPGSALNALLLSGGSVGGPAHFGYNAVNQTLVADFRTGAGGTGVGSDKAIQIPLNFAGSPIFPRAQLTNGQILNGTLGSAVASGVMTETNTVVGKMQPNAASMGFDIGALLQVPCILCPASNGTIPTRMLAYLNLLGPTTIRINSAYPYPQNVTYVAGAARGTVSGTAGACVSGNVGYTSNCTGQIGTLTLGDFAAFVCAAPAGTNVIWGLPSNFLTLTPQGQSTATSVAEAQAIYGLIGPSGTVCTNRFLAFEIGNEPDGKGNYDFSGADQAGTTQSTQGFAQMWNTIANAIVAAIPTATFSGPATGQARWTSAYLSAFLAYAPGGALLSNAALLTGGVLTQHYYRFGSNSGNTIANLLLPDSTITNPLTASPTGGMAAELLSYSQSSGLPVVIDETNSAAIGGQPNLSNTFASALWDVDYMLSYNEISYNSTLGVGTVMIHINCSETPGSTTGACYTGGYTAIQTQVSSNFAGIMPLFYGLYLQAAQIGAGNLLAVTCSAGTVNLTCHDVYSGGRHRVVLANKDVAKTAVITATLSTTVSAASYITMGSTTLGDTSTSVMNISGVTIQSNGSLSGTITPTSLALSGGNTFSITVPAHTVAVVTAL